MSTVIIGGGDNARAAISKLETTSVDMSDEQRSCAEAILKAVASMCDDYRQSCGL